MAGQSLGTGLFTCARMIVTHPGHQMASRNKKKWVHFQPCSKCPSQPANYYERFLKETLSTLFQSGLRDFTQFSKEGKLSLGCWESLFQVNQNKLPSCL